MSMSPKNRPLLICILDGVGHTDRVEGNAVLAANTPVMDQMAKERPQCLLRTDGEYVGLPPGQMGNSEVGHITIGSGRIIRQSLDRITYDLDHGLFAGLPGFESFAAAASKGRAIHLIGLFSDGGVHSHSAHALGIARILNEIGIPVYIHAIGDGRDVGMKSGAAHAAAFAKEMQSFENVHIASVIGRHFAMDRDSRWDRTGAAWNLYVKGEGEVLSSAEAAYLATYEQGEYDEYVPASRMSLFGTLDSRIKDNDSVLFFNFRADRMRQLARCFLGMEESFAKDLPKLKAVGTMTSYDEEYQASNLHIIYPPEAHQNTLGEVLSREGLKQLRLAETEKFPHVTFFFNAGKDEPWANEERILVPSPKEVRSYDLKPEMSLPEVTRQAVAAIESGTFDVVVMNIANGDLVGHCGIMEASIKAVEAVDHALSQILPALEKAGGEGIIFADHGNCEEMIVDGKPSTAHSTNPVVCTYVGPRALSLHDGGLSDIAPTALHLLGIPIPAEMTGKPLTSV
jgi:2,3-bisphosphoglycerate-independent phosphoglycerate mutase